MIPALIIIYLSGIWCFIDMGSMVKEGSSKLDYVLAALWPIIVVLMAATSIFNRVNGRNNDYGL